MWGQHGYTDAVTEAFEATERLVQLRKRTATYLEPIAVARGEMTHHLWHACWRNEIAARSTPANGNGAVTDGRWRVRERGTGYAPTPLPSRRQQPNFRLGVLLPT